MIRWFIAAGILTSVVLAQTTQLHRVAADANSLPARMQHGKGNDDDALPHRRAHDDCSEFQELLLFYGDETTCGNWWYYWMNGTCYTEPEIYFSAQGVTWGPGLSAMFVADFLDPTQSAWTFYVDAACQRSVHGIDGLSCNRCAPNPSDWVLSIGGYNVTGYQIVNSPTTATKAVDGYNQGSSAHRHHTAPHLWTDNKNNDASELKRSL